MIPFKQWILSGRSRSDGLEGISISMHKNVPLRQTVSIEGSRIFAFKRMRTENRFDRTRPHPWGQRHGHLAPAAHGHMAAAAAWDAWDADIAASTLASISVVEGRKAKIISASRHWWGWGWDTQMQTSALGQFQWNFPGNLHD